MGMFSAPNTTAIMNAVPAEYRGVSSGMIATFRNIASTLSITLIFSLVTVGLAKHLPGTLLSGLTKAGIPQSAAATVSHLPPVAAIFAAFLGYNPLGTLLPPDVLQGVSEATRNTVLGNYLLPQPDLRAVHGRRTRRLQRLRGARRCGGGRLLLARPARRP